MYKSIKIVSLFVGFSIFLIALNLMFLWKFNDVRASSNYGYEGISVVQLKKDLECMALNIYREAGNEPIEGRIAVAQVTMNRVAHPDFPDTVCGVVYQKNVVMSRVVCQFSWYCDSTHRNRPVYQQSYQESYEVAKKVMLEGFRLKSLEDALYYHADYVNPRWRLQKIQQIGTHIFYRKGLDHEKLAGI